MQHLEGSGTPVLYIGHTVLKGYIHWSETQLCIFAQDSTLCVQLHVSALYIGHREVVLQT
jgi:hypothetical protein